MATTSPDESEDAPAPLLPSDWPQQATARLVDTVDTIRSKTSGPAIRVSRGIVYGLVALILALIAIPLILVGLTRLLIGSIDSGFLWFIPGMEHDKAVWVAYLSIGAVLCAAGLLVWSRRPRHAAEPARPA
jgi:hypothetical protein